MSKIRSIEENKINDKELNLALLVSKWLVFNRGLDFDTYVEKYSNNSEFKKEVDRQIELVEFAEAMEKEILERAFYMVDDYSAWDDLIEEDDGNGF